MKKKKAFTLIEVIIASAILSITVFWVYKLIWENSKLINNSNNYLQLNNLFLNLEECIKSKKTDFLSLSSWATKEINFWASLTWCESWTSSTVLIDNIDYYMEILIKTKENKYSDIELIIKWDWVWIDKKDFRLYK